MFSVWSWHSFRFSALRLSRETDGQKERDGWSLYQPLSRSLFLSLYISGGSGPGALLPAIQLLCMCMCVFVVSEHLKEVRYCTGTQWLQVPVLNSSLSLYSCLYVALYSVTQLLWATVHYSLLPLSQIIVHHFQRQCLILQVCPFLIVIDQSFLEVLRLLSASVRLSVSVCWPSFCSIWHDGTYWLNNPVCEKDHTDVTTKSPRADKKSNVL